MIDVIMRLKRCAALLASNVRESGETFHNFWRRNGLIRLIRDFHVKLAKCRG